MYVVCHLSQPSRARHDTSISLGMTFLHAGIGHSSHPSTHDTSIFSRKAAQYTTEYVDERPMAMRFEVTGHRGAVNFVAAYGPTDVATAGSKQLFWDKLHSLVRRVPAKECLSCSRLLG